MIIVEKFGEQRRFRDGKLELAVIKGPDGAYKAGPNGLLDIALDPEFATTRRVFLAFTEGTDHGARCAVYRARLTDAALVDGEVIYRGNFENMVPLYPPCGSMLFLPDKTFLLGSPMDEEHRHLVQSLDNDQGKIIRLDRDGKPPGDNPFVARPGALPEIYAYGTRSPLSMILHPETGEVWENENGPRGGDELNLLKPGANYGWPLTTFGIDYDGREITPYRELPGIESPVVYWVPSSIAPAGMTVYDGDRYPQWRGDFFIATLIGRHVRRVRLEGMELVEQEIMLSDLKERFRTVRVGPDGYLYLLTDNINGRLLRLRPGHPSADEAARIAQPADNAVSPTVTVGRKKWGKPDLTRGKQLFAQLCSSCHSIDPAATGRPGPHLYRILGRTSGTLPGFDYSPALRAAGRIWTERLLDHFMAGSEALVPGTTMFATPVPDTYMRRDVVGYLADVSG